MRLFPEFRIVSNSLFSIVTKGIVDKKLSLTDIDNDGVTATLCSMLANNIPVKEHITGADSTIGILSVEDTLRLIEVCSGLCKNIQPSIATAMWMRDILVQVAPTYKYVNATSDLLPFVAQRFDAPVIRSVTDLKTFIHSTLSGWKFELGSSDAMRHFAQACRLFSEQPSDFTNGVISWNTWTVVFHDIYMLAIMEKKRYDQAKLEAENKECVETAVQRLRRLTTANWTFKRREMVTPTTVTGYNIPDWISVVEILAKSTAEGYVLSEDDIETIARTYAHSFNHRAPGEFAGAFGDGRHPFEIELNRIELMKELRSFVDTMGEGSEILVLCKRFIDAADDINKSTAGPKILSVGVCELILHDLVVMARKAATPVPAADVEKDVFEQLEELVAKASKQLHDGEVQNRFDTEARFLVERLRETTAALVECRKRSSEYQESVKNAMTRTHREAPMNVNPGIFDIAGILNPGALQFNLDAGFTCMAFDLSKVVPPRK